MPNITEPSLINLVESGVRPEDVRDYYAFRRLVVLKEGRHHARQGERASVEGVGQLRLAVIVAVAQVQTVGLVGLEVGHGGDFQPPLLRR